VDDGTLTAKQLQRALLARLTPDWVSRSIRNRLLAMAWLPLLVVLPLLLMALLAWGTAAYDRLLITKVQSDLAVARGYFGQVQNEVGSGTEAIAASHELHVALARNDLAAMHGQLARERTRLGFDFINLYDARGALLTANWQTPAVAVAGKSSGANAALRSDEVAASTPRPASVTLLDASVLLAMAPDLAPRIHIPLVPTRGAAATTRSVENRAMVLLSTIAVRGTHGETLALLRGGVLLNQNLPLIDHINRIVYPSGSLPLGSHGTATLFMDDVRITTNVRLFQGQRAIGTRVSQAVRDAVLGRGDTWLDRAFVVNDWYVSGYEPLRDASGKRIGMLYVGYLEEPFRLVKYTMLAMIVGIFLLVMVLAAMFSLRWARSIFKPLESMNHTIARVEGGDTGARVGPVEARDEVGALANHLDQLLDVIDDKTGALQRWADELDTKVVERTRDLAASFSDLTSWRWTCCKASLLAAIGQIAASVAHEINNPIAVIQGNLDLMREALGDHAAPVTSELHLLDQQIDRMRLIVTQLLQYARPTEYAGYVDAVDVNRAIDGALLLVGHLMAHAHVSVERDTRVSTRAGINPQELQQVLINLLTNALQAMPEGGRLWLGASDQVDTQGRSGVVLEVGDSGAGLDDQARDRLFRPFFTTKTDGNGLGLWVSLGLVERYGGSIRGENWRERGSDRPGAVFTVWLLREPVTPDSEGAGNNFDEPPGSDTPG
jgi:two-component system NtrC family sensor kinase